MKKSLPIIATGVMFVAGAMTASADRYYQRGDYPVSAEEIEAGVQYALNCGAPDASGQLAFLRGTSFLFGTENITADCLYTFEVAGKNSKGETIYYIKNSEGQYFTAPGRAIGYTENKDNAWKVTIKTVNNETPDGDALDSGYSYTDENDTDLEGMAAYRAEYRENGTGFDLSNASFYAEAEVGLVITGAEPDDASDICSTYTYLLGVGAGATNGNVNRGTNYNTNVWVIYTVEEQSASAYLESLINELFPDGWDPETVNVGEDPGCYPQEAVDALTEAYEAALEATEENAEERAEALKAAYEKFQHSFVLFGEGYYVFESYRTLNSEKHGVVMDNMGDAARAQAQNIPYNDRYRNHIVVTNSSGTTIGDFDTFDPENEDWMKTEGAPYFVWHVTKAGFDADGNQLYYMQNFKTERYIGTVDGFNKSVSATDEPVNAYNMMPSEDGNGWMFYSPDLPVKNGWKYAGLHCPGDWNGLVAWDWTAEASRWKPYTVTDEMLETIKANMVQPALNGELRGLVADAESTKNDNIIDDLSFNGKDIAPAAEIEAWLSFEEVDGLVTSEDQISSEFSDPDEGAELGFLIDGDATNLWHSSWHAGTSPTDDEGNILPHNLVLDLGQVCSDVTIKIASRDNGSSGQNGTPRVLSIYGSNDGENWTPVNVVEYNTEIVENEDGEEEEVTTEVEGTGVAVNWYNLAHTAGTSNSFVGWFTTKLGFQYIRFDVIHTGGLTGAYKDIKGNDGLYFNLAELRAYGSAEPWVIMEDPNSPYYVAPEADRKAVDDLVAQANEELEDELATPETIEALKKALETLKAGIPNPTLVKDLTVKAQELCSAAEVGENPGYFTQEDIDAFQKAIDDVKNNTKNSMSVLEVKAAVDALQAAIDAFQAALIKPENGIYFIKSKSDAESNFGAYVYTQNNSKKDKVTKGFIGKDEVAANTLGAYWQIEKVENGFAFKNVYTGLYLAPVGKETDVVAQSEAPYVYTLQYAQEPGCFNAVIAKEDAFNETYIYLNMQPGGGMVTWGSAKGRDNSAFEFVPVAEADLDNVISNGFNYNLEIAAAPQIAVFPVDLYTESIDDVVFYTVIGQDDANNIQLAKTETVVAGQAYVLVPAEGVEGTAVVLYTEAESLKDLKPSDELQAPVNGLVPVFESTIVPNKCGIFTKDHSVVTYSEGTEDDTVRPNSGYFNEMPVATAKGDAFIPSRGQFANGIQNIIMSTDVEQGIYSISGVRVNSVKNLPAGLYIINGKKFIVK